MKIKLKFVKILNVIMELKKKKNLFIQENKDIEK